eukprot:TRINITY_DN10324_c0_g1_i2.p1 TRINITY_DN10324_c0_g1~~TRINITY_DN10324_c0_g1_i2.p1  ORF type:complete len:503 (+),score=124.84 TRINITY_DN10324_c0_g1_i2:74-1582(+)
MPEQFSHRRTYSEVRYCKRLERTDLKPSEWDKFGYADRSDVLTRPIQYDSQTVPIPRVKRSEITPEWFYENYASKNLPVIIEGGCADWPAMNAWAIDKLEERFRHVAFKVGEASKGKKLRMKFKYYADYLRQQRDDNPLYLFETDVNDNAHIKPLVDDYVVPDLFPHDWLNLVNHDARPPWRWWCIGPKRSGTTVHIDPLNTSAWNAVTHGRKRWVLFEPEVPKKVAKGKGLRQKGEDDEAIMYFDFILPRLKQANPDVRVYEGIQNPGDVIFVPGAWWHGVLNLEDCVAATQNYVGPDNFDSVWRRARKDREKTAYLWLRNMRKFAPQLYERAVKLNEEDKFKMRHDRSKEEKLEKDSSSSSESSDSSSDEAEDLSPTGLAGAVAPGLILGTPSQKRPRRVASPSVAGAPWKLQRCAADSASGALASASADAAGVGRASAGSARAGSAGASSASNASAGSASVGSAGSAGSAGAGSFCVGSAGAAPGSSGADARDGAELVE